MRIQQRSYVASLLFCGTVLLAYLAPSRAGALPGEGEINIMCLGDSITHGLTTTDHYRHHLWELFQDNGHSNIDFVGTQNTLQGGVYDWRTGFDKDHQGQSGWRAEHILWGGGYSLGGSGKLWEWLTTLQNQGNLPDIVLLHIGTNDVISGGNNVAQDINEIKQIINTLRRYNPNVIILTAKIIPHKLSGVPSVNLLNEAIATLESYDTTSSQVHIVDMNKSFGNTWFADYTHPNSTGASVMAKRWYRALNRTDILIPALAEIVSITPVAGGQLQIQWNGHSGRVYQLQGTTDMESWTEISNGVSTGPSSSTRFTPTATYIGFRFKSVR